MLDQYFVQTAYILTVSRNKFGDYTETAQTAIPCRFREISTLRRTSNQEIRDADAMIWVAASVSVARGTIILFDSIEYQVERITKARRLGEDEVQFLKCDLKVIGVS